jgi:hypothetical protein
LDIFEQPTSINEHAKKTLSKGSCWFFFMTPNGFEIAETSPSLATKT